jgi:histone H3/H4
MDKDDNLFEDEIKESSDLLDIGLDDLTDDFSGEAAGEETGEGVIDLTDLVEKGDINLFNEDEILKDDIKITDDLGLNLAEEASDEFLLDENLSNDSVAQSSDKDITGDLFEKLLDETELEEISADTDELPEVEKEFSLEPEDFSDLESVLKEEAVTGKTASDNPAPVNIQGNLFKDFDTGGAAPLKTDGLDEEETAGPDIFGSDLEKTIASSDDDSDNKPLWGTDSDINTSGAETDGISILEETSSDDEAIEYSGIDEGAPGYVHLDDIQLDGKVLETIFPDEAAKGDIPESAPLSADFPQAGSRDMLLSDMDQPEIALTLEPAEPEIPAINNGEPEHEIPAAPVEATIQPLVSEERIEEIVTKVVSEVVERVAREVVGEAVEKVAREVFADVAERVISEAIDGLKKSLETESV